MRRRRPFYQKRHDLETPRASAWGSQVLDARAERDWKRACSVGALRHVERYDDDADRDDDGDGESDESAEVAAVYLKHERIVRLVFAQYAAASSSLEVISLVAWRHMYEDFKLAEAKSKACTVGARTASLP